MMPSWRGREAQLAGGRERTPDQALALYYQAIKLDPSFASAYAAAAFCYNMRKTTAGCWTSKLRRQKRNASLKLP